MKTTIQLFTALLFCSIGFEGVAQQDPIYTHYMYNTLSINPAYAGSRDALTITGLHRSQWVDFKGAPITQTLTIHTPIANKHIGIGIGLTNDKIGPINNTTVTGSFAYRMQLTERSKLALGINGGVSILQANLSQLQLEQQNDVVFQNNLSNRTTPVFGVGVYYSRERFYAGISVPNLIQSNYSTIKNEIVFNGKSQRHYFFTMGTLIKLNEDFDFKPTTMVRFTDGAPLQADITAAFVYRDRFLLGAMVRSGDAVGALIGLNISDQFYLGYSFDWSYGLSTARYNQGSHEIMLRYDFIFGGKNQIHSPRYF